MGVIDKKAANRSERRVRTVEFIPKLINQGPGNALRAFCAMQKPSTVKAYVTAMDRGNIWQQKTVFYLKEGLKELFTFPWSQPVYHSLITYDYTYTTTDVFIVSIYLKHSSRSIFSSKRRRHTVRAWDERERGDGDNAAFFTSCPLFFFSLWLCFVSFRRMSGRWLIRHNKTYFVCYRHSYVLDCASLLGIRRSVLFVLYYVNSPEV